MEPKPFSDENKERAGEKDLTSLEKWQAKEIDRLRELITNRDDLVVARLAADRKRIKQLESRLDEYKVMPDYDIGFTAGMAAGLKIKKVLDDRLTELERFDGNDDHPENRCERCRGRNLHNWYTDNDIWNSVVGEDWSVLCPNCLVELAKIKGIDPSAWRLSVEGDFPELNKVRVELNNAIDEATKIEAENQRLREILQGLLDAAVMSDDMSVLNISISELMFIEITQALHSQKGE